MTRLDSTKTSIVTTFIVISLILVFLTAFTKYIFAKDYQFYIEAPCDATQQTCFVRDCDDYCPPNGLDTYKAYYIKAADFEQCTDNSCDNICLDSSTSQNCENIPCKVETDTCSVPEE